MELPVVGGGAQSPDGEGKPVQAGGPPASVSEFSDCATCEQRLADAECHRCETPVCRMHYDAEMGLCAECAQRAKPDGRRGDTFLY